jgi:hypothetical protein
MTSPSSLRSSSLHRFTALAIVGALCGCGAELQSPSDDEASGATFSATGLTWQLPFNATSWRIGFDIYNSYLAGQTSKCFGTTMDKIKHAGEDWAGTTSTQVGAIGDGQVVYAGNVNYPGNVVVVRHDLSDAQRRLLGLSTPIIYSQYGHMTSLAVAAGARVTAGQRLGTLLDQGSNTHLHWEVRSVEKPALCGTTHWGPGYTGPGTTATSYGYLHPSNTVNALKGGGGSSCPSGDGLYCGGNGVSGSAGTLYRCSGGTLSVAQVCSYGCEHMPAGVSDRCAAAPGRCTVASGLYCGGNGVTGAANILYRCTSGTLSYVETCAAGCERRPSGYPDRCK